MRTRLLVASLYLLGLGCSSPARPSGGGTGGEEETGGSPGSTGGKSGGDTGGKSGGTGGKSGGTGGSGDTGGSSGGNTGGAMGGSGGGNTGGATGGSGGGSGGGGAGGTPTGGSGGGGGASAGPGCAGVTNAKFCDDFEGMGMPGAFTMGAGITIDGTKARSGTKALHFKVGGASFVTFTKQFPVNDLYGRLMLFMSSTPGTSNHWDLIRSNSTIVRIQGKGPPQWSIGGQFGKFELVCDPPDNGIDSNTPFPGGKWVCIQWHFGFDPNGNKTTFLAQVDGMPVDKGMFTGPKGTDWQASAWKDLAIGWELFPGGASPEFWVDDLAFGEQPIPCPGP